MNSSVQLNQKAELVHGPAEEIHKKYGASFAEFGGWLMPVSYAGTVAEHHAVRTAVGLFDVSHLGKVYVQGLGAVEFVNSLFTNDLNKIGPGKAQYTLCTDINGGVIDDLIVYYESDDSLFLVPNAVNTTAVVALLQEYSLKQQRELTIRNAHKDFAIFAVQGILSDNILENVGLPTNLDYMAFTDAGIHYNDMIYPVRLCRTGYTGEHGYELITPWNHAEQVLEILIERVHAHSGQLAGLGARDTLRTEMGYPLHGHELSLHITPVQAGVSWAIGWKKPTFLGKASLEAEKKVGPARRLRALKAVNKGIPRRGYAVLDSHGTIIGECTSGTFSPTLEVGIALAFIDTAADISTGSEVFVDIRGRLSPVIVESLPFVDSHVR